MATVIRSAALGGQPRRLASRSQVRETSTPKPEPAQPPVEKPAPAPAARQADPAVERERERQAQVDREAAREKASREGYEAGHAKGLEDAQASCRDKLRQLDQLLQGASDALAGEIDVMEDIAVGIAFAAVAKIIGKSLVTPAGVRAAVQQVLQRARSDERLVVRLAPGDFYLLLQQRDESEAPWPSTLELAPDERIELGGCLVETNAGTLDARIETQMAELRRVLLQARGQGVPATGGR